MLILILIDVQYLLKVVFSFEEGSNIENHSSLGSQHSRTKFPWTKFSILPPSRGGGVFPPLFKACVRYFLSKFYFSPNDSSSITMKNVFYFI